MSIDIVKVHSKKNNKDYEVLKITIGDLEKIIFLSPFELKYAKKEIERNA